MVRVKPWRTRSLISILSLGAIFLGIGFILWAMLSVLELTGHSDITPSSNYGAALVDVNSQVAEVRNLYPNYPSEGDNIGRLSIPALNRELQIFQGTGTQELKKGVGHYLGSVLPGEKDNSVLSGHRETVFRELDNLKKGDLLIVETSAGLFTYEVTGTRIVDKDDRTVIVPTEEAVLTLTTCYPFGHIGNAPERYIVSATLKNN